MPDPAMSGSGILLLNHMWLRAAGQVIRLKITEALTPPKPKPFDST